MKKLISVIFLAMIFVSCDKNESNSDAFGNFEATEITISAETQGKIINFDVNEGNTISENDIICVVDTTSLHLQKKEINANISSIKSGLQNINPQIEVFDQQISYLTIEKRRVEKLIAGKAATQKQLDEINAKIEANQKQKDALISKMSDGNRAILAKIEPLEVKLLQIEDMINKSVIKSPITGNIMEKYFEYGEFARPGAALAMVADINKMHLKAYISGDQLAAIKLNKEVKVMIDNKDSQKSYSGKIVHIADKAEFTPKTIQTKKERVNLVYEVKIEVINDGSIKIGMPGDVKF